MRVAFFSLLLLLVAGIGFWIAPFQPSGEVALSEVVTADTEPRALQPETTSVERVQVPQKTAENSMEPELDRVSSLLLCLQSDDLETCLEGFDIPSLSAGEVAKILKSTYIDRSTRVNLLTQVLLKLEPWNFSSFVEAVFQDLDGRFNERASFFESSLYRLRDNHEEWLYWIGGGMTAGEVFAEGQSDLLVVFLSGIDNKPETLDSILYQGALGELGGTSTQVERAYQLAMARKIREAPSEAMTFTNAIMESPHLSAEAAYSIAQHSVHMVSSLARKGELHAEEIESFLAGLLDDPRFQVGAAAQFKADYLFRLYPGLDEVATIRFRQESQRVLDLKYK